MKKTRKALALFLIMCIFITCAAAEEFTDEYGGEPVYDAYGIDNLMGEIYYEPPTINTDAEVKLGYVASPGTNINPLYCDERDLISLNRLVFESVVDLDDNFKPMPMLADSWSVDGKTWTFNLRQGIVFHNGAEFTAADVYLTWQRFLYDGIGSPYYSRLAMIENMTVVSTYVLEVTAKYSGYITLYAMTFPVMQSSTIGDVTARGTGPYWYTEYVQGVGVRLEMNPLWWKKDAKVKSIAAINYRESSEALAALQMGEIDMLCTRSNRASLYRKLSDLTSMDYTTNTFEVLIPNLDESSCMSDIRMRQMLMYAIDRATIAENAYGGMGVQCEVPVNPASWLYESQSAVYYYSPERALQLVLDCGWQDLTGDGMMNKINGVRLEDLTVRIITYNEPTNSIRENACNIIAEYLETIGVNATVKSYSKERLQSRIKDKEYDLALVSFEMSDIPNLTQLLTKGGDINLNGYNNEDMQNLLTQITSATTEEELKNIYSQIQMTIVDRLPIMGLLFRTGTILSHRSLSGLSGMRESDVLNGFEFMESYQ